MRVAADTSSLPLTHDGYRSLCIEQGVNIFEGRGLHVQVRYRGVVCCATVLKVNRTCDGLQLYKCKTLLGEVWCRHDQVRACQGVDGGCGFCEGSGS